MNINTKKNTILILETVVVFLIISYLAFTLLQRTWRFKWIFYIPLLVFQGFWFYRFYIVGHEAAHRKLFVKHPKLNDIIGSIILLPLMTPITIYRKIHNFHHAFNRKDNHTSALDTFTTQKLTPLRKYYFYLVWFIGVFLGGFFIHSLVSVFLFLFIPPRIASRISPAFNDWKMKDQLTSILLFALGLGFHYLTYAVFGKQVYLSTLGYPMLAFAWILSMIVYIFHYKTTIGNQVRFNVRAIDHIPFFSWVLMNFNEHATHHQFPNISWYDLREKRKALPASFAKKNQTTHNFLKAILQQIEGPTIIDESKYPKID